MKILSIGNSFSIDAQNYLHAIAHQDKEEISAANLYIGDCTLEIHYRNMLSQRAAYEYWFNGHNTFLKVSLDDVLLSSSWDVVTLQQGSNSLVLRIAGKNVSSSGYLVGFDHLALEQRES